MSLSGKSWKSLAFFPQQGVRSGGKKLAVRTERGKECREVGHLAPARVEKNRCLAMFSGLITWRNLFWEWQSWRCKVSSLGAGMPWLPGAQKLALSFLFAVFSRVLGTEVTTLQPCAAITVTADHFLCQSDITCILLISPSPEELPQLGEP